MQGFSNCQMKCEFKILLYLTEKPVANWAYTEQRNTQTQQCLCGIVSLSMERVQIRYE